FRSARCHGTYGHSGAQPRPFRNDAVAATVALIAALEQRWEALEVAGGDLTFTVGELYTDAAFHGPSQIAGETSFVLDLRSIHDPTMIEMRALTRRLGDEIGARFRVRFALGDELVSAPALLDRGIQARFTAIAGRLGIATMAMASGAGHDASVFANLGVPSA